MGDLIKLPNAAIDGELPAPNANIVEYLETQLEEAKSGRLQAIAFVGVNYDDLVVRYAFYVGEDECRPGVMAGVGYLSYEVARDSSEKIDEDDDKAPEGTGDGL